MRPLTPALISIALVAAWLGAALVVAAVVAPAAFDVLPTRTLAGALVGRRDWLDAAEPHQAGGGAVRRVGVSDGTTATEWASSPERHEGGTPNVLGALALGSQRLLPLLQQAFLGWSGTLGNRQALADMAAVLTAPAIPDTSAPSTTPAASRPSARALPSTPREPFCSSPS